MALVTVKPSIHQQNGITVEISSLWMNLLQNQPEVSALKTGSTNSLIDQEWIRRSKDANKTKHIHNVFWVAIVLFSHFSTQETAPFAFSDWVRLWQPSNKFIQVNRPAWSLENLPQWMKENMLQGSEVNWSHTTIVRPTTVFGPSRVTSLSRISTFALPSFPAVMLPRSP